MLHAVNEVYDTRTDTWTTQAPMPIPRHGVPAVTLDDRVLMPAGGIVQGLQPTNAVDSFIPAPGPGDFDGDGDVDLSDFAVFTQCFGGAFNPPAVGCPVEIDADLDSDGDVDLGDFAVFSQHFTGSGAPA